MISLAALMQLKQDVREAYAYFFPEQECDLATVLVYEGLSGPKTGSYVVF